jgi:hypothetical protein
MRKVFIGLIGISMVFVNCQRVRIYRDISYLYPNWTPDGKIICLERDVKLKTREYVLFMPGEDFWLLEVKYKVIEVDKEGNNFRQIAIVANARGEDSYEEVNTSELYYLLEEVGHPSLSCSSDKIVFSVWGRHYEKYEMWIINRDGSGLKKLSDKGTYPDLSPDGKRVVYEKPGEGIWIINADGTGDHQITNDPADCYPIWSPSGDKIAFLRYGLYIVDTTGSNLQPIPASGVEFPDWSWDGRYIVTGGRYIFDLQTMKEDTVNLFSNPKFSPDGTMFVGGHTNIETINIDGSNRKGILEGRYFVESEGLW